MSRSSNDRSPRDRHWRHHPGDPWDAFDRLPAAIRTRLSQHAYDPWSRNALLLWQRIRRMHGEGARAERAMIRALDRCEQLERALFAADHGGALPHDAARASVLRGTRGARTR